MKLLIDMNLSPDWTRHLAGEGFTAVHWSEIGPSNASDSVVLQWALEHDHVLLTADLDFGAILAATQQAGPSVVQLRSDALAPEEIGGAVFAALRRTREDLLAGALVSVDPRRSRVRILPITDQRESP